MSAKGGVCVCVCVCLDWISGEGEDICREEKRMLMFLVVCREDMFVCVYACASVF